MIGGGGRGQVLLPMSGARVACWLRLFLATGFSMTRIGFVSSYA